MFDYVKLPNKLFYTSKYNAEGEKSYLKQIPNDKLLLVLAFLYSNVNRKDVIKFTLENMITECGFKPNNSKPKKSRNKKQVPIKKNNDQFKDILIQLEKLKIISCDLDLNKIKPKDLIVLKDLHLFETVKDKSTGELIDVRYFELYEKEKNKILTYKHDKGKIDNLKLLLYYCYLKARMYKRAKDDGDLNMSGGKAETCNPKYETIKKDLGLTDESITKYNSILVKLNMIRIGNPGLWYYKDDPKKFVRESVNVYSLYLGEEEITRHNLKEGIESYKNLDTNSNKIWTNNKSYKNNNRKLNGAYGAIVRKENNGTATADDLKRKNELLASINADEEQYKIKALFEINQGLLLSYIYSDFGKEDIADKYYEIETSLNLLDDNEDLTVDWDYYCWVMENYKKEEHDYYVNCVKKHIRENMNDTEEEQFIETAKHKGIRNLKEDKKIIETNDDDWGGEADPFTAVDDEILNEIADANYEQIPVEDRYEFIHGEDEMTEEEQEYLEEEKRKNNELMEEYVPESIRWTNEHYDEDSCADADLF